MVVTICEICYHVLSYAIIIHSRYSDFLVNEIDVEGQVVQLTNISCPVEAVPASTVQVSW